MPSAHNLRHGFGWTHVVYIRPIQNGPPRVQGKDRQRRQVPGGSECAAHPIAKSAKGNSRATAREHDQDICLG